MHWNIYRDQIKEYQKKMVWTNDSPKAILISGATGMIGSALVDLLLAANDSGRYHFHVYAMGRSKNRGERRFKAYWSREDFDFIEHDVTKLLASSLCYDYIIHAASNAYPQAFVMDPVGTMTANFLGIYNMLEYARQMKGSRVLYVSSGEVYGELDKAVKAERDYGYVDLLDVRSCYPNSKRAAETLCVAYSQQYNVDTVIVRPSHVYGPTMTERDNRAVSEFLRHAAAGKDIVMRSTGAIIRSYTYVLDAAMGILVALLKGKRATAYNIAADQKCISIKEIAEYLAKVGKVKLIMDLPKDAAKLGYSTISRQVLDAGMIHALGWECQVDTYQGLKETLAILR